MHPQDNGNHHPTRRLGKGMAIAAWLLVLGLLTLFFNNWLEDQRNPNRQVHGMTAANGVREVILQRNRYGHYVANAAINGRAVEVLLDTGATLVSVPDGLARALDLRRGPAIPVETANGTITTYATRLSRIQLGDIVVHDVTAAINPRSDDVLLGMSFLKHLEFTQRGDTLTLHQYGPDG